MKKQTEDDLKTQQMRICLSFCGVCISNATAELIWRCHHAMMEFKGDFSVKDGIKLQSEIEEKYNKLSKKKSKNKPNE